VGRTGTGPDDKGTLARGEDGRTIGALAQSNGLFLPPFCPTLIAEVGIVVKWAFVNGEADFCRLVKFRAPIKMMLLSFASFM
jgi:hypothetical protein